MRTGENSFLKEGFKLSAETTSCNGAFKFSKTENPFVTQFGSLSLEQRSYAEIAADCEELWEVDKTMTIKFILFIRMITRKTTVNGKTTQSVQKGAGLRHESIMRMIWLMGKDMEVAAKVLPIFIAVGSPKDLVTMFRYSYIHDVDVPKHYIVSVIKTLLSSEEQSDLMKKYIPTKYVIKRTKTNWRIAGNKLANMLSADLFGADLPASERNKLYRRLKASGKAHEWQKYISKREFQNIDFERVHSRALNLMATTKFLTNSGLTEEFLEFIDGKETVSYTGYPHEVFKSYLKGLKRGDKRVVTDITNKQFLNLVERSKEKVETKFIVVRDTSASMGGTCPGTGMSCHNVSKSLAIFFSYFLTGSFSNAWIEFNRTAQLKKWVGNSPCEKWTNDQSCANESTNFLSVAELFAELKTIGVKEEDFPEGIICLSDGEFNPAYIDDTNVSEFRTILLKAGFSKKFAYEFKIVLWNLKNSYYGDSEEIKFETYDNIPNVFYFSGFSPEIISFLINGKVNERIGAVELFTQAMNQEVLNLVDEVL